MNIDENVSAEDEAAVISGLRAFNEVRLGPANQLPVKLVVRDDIGAVVGGLLGHTKWNWMYVDRLWVAESARGHGWGTKLMDRAEALGRERGCTDIFGESWPRTLIKSAFVTVVYGLAFAAVGMALLGYAITRM